MSYLIFDIETVPDTTVWTPPPVKRNKDDSVSKRQPDTFPPLYAHRPIAIGFIALGDDLSLLQMGCAGTTSFGDNESALLAGWSHFVSSLQAPTLVSFNGRDFDLAVLALRSFLYGISQGDVDYRSRYAKNHIDLEQELVDGVYAKTGFSLDTFSTLIGLPPKGDMSGSKVAGMFANGQAANIEAYCVTDCAKIAFVLFRLLLLRGRITIEQYRTAAAALLQTCIDKGLGGVSFGANTKKLLLEE